MPAKYPFKTLDIETNGKVKAIATSIGPAFGSFNKFIAIKSCVNKIIKINIKLIVNINAAALVKMRILRPLFSATNFDIEIGIANVDMVKSREYVGVAIVYRLIPYGPIILVKTILIIKPNILVRKPLIISINVDFTNKLFFIQSPLIINYFVI